MQQYNADGIRLSMLSQAPTHPTTSAKVVPYMTVISHLNGTESTGELLSLRRAMIKSRRQRQAAELNAQPLVRLSHNQPDTAVLHPDIPDYPRIA